MLSALLEHFQTVEIWQRDNLQGAIHAVVERLDVKMGKVGAPLRLAMLGKLSGVDLPVVLELLGRDKCAERLQNAIHWINNSAAAK